jgi:O-methyltransferase
MLGRTHYLDNLRLVAETKIEPSEWVVECGTWKGGMAAGMVSITKGIANYGFFDSFEGLPSVKEIDGDRAKNWQQNKESDYYYDNCTAALEDFQRTLAKTGLSNNQISFYKGWFESTVPSMPQREIALLRLDGDWYESTLVCLESFFPMLKEGGLLIIDDYDPWSGCTQAIHDYLSSRGRNESVKRSRIASVPYIIKNSNS